MLRKTPTSAINVEEEVSVLKRDGILRIENFLSDEDFAAIQAEYLALYPGFKTSSRVTIPVQKRQFVSTSRLDAPESIDFKDSQFHRLIAKNDKLNAVIMQASKRKINLMPTGAYTEEFYLKEDLGEKSQTGVVNPHYDVPYHSYKAFFYIEDVDESNGAFHYSTGSNRFNLRRLLLEYFTSINIASKNKEIQVDFSQTDMFKTYRDSMTAITGKKNTLVIFDAMGIHQRGSFSVDTPRRMVQVCYRPIESFANKSVSMIKRLVNS
ncbi:MAG: phytanoyl-CoA dioxygenase family protein [Arenicella sp.]